MRSSSLALLIGAILTGGFHLRSLQAGHASVTVRPDTVVDLRTTEGVALIAGAWRYHDTTIQSIEHRDVGPDLKATGQPNHTFDFSPDARAADYDDISWEKIDPATLDRRRGHGRLSFNWYRLSVTLPDKIETVPIDGAAVVFELVLDDYAEIWVNGQLPLVLGQQGGQVPAGWNAPNRVLLTRHARPGQQFQIAVFGINGPLSVHPDTYIWIRSATLDIYRAGKLTGVQPAKLDVDRKHSELDAVLPQTPRLEKLAEGFAFTEGPVWVPQGEGYLLFSDPNNNTIYRLDPEGDVSVYRPKSGYTGSDIAQFGQPGSNGLALDQLGRLTVCEHGNRRVTRIENNGTVTPLAERFQGRRLNSPNDLVYRSDGTLYFTDPPFGLPKFHQDPRRELTVAGVYRLHDGTLDLVTSQFSGPNGLAFSPDETELYIGNWDDKQKVVYRFPIAPDGSHGTGVLFCDLTSAPGEDAIDGVKVDQQGHVFVSGPGGLWIFNAEGRHLGTLRGPEHAHNMAWGGADGRDLYLTAQTGVYRLRLNVPGHRPFQPDRPRLTAQ